MLPPFEEKRLWCLTKCNPCALGPDTEFSRQAVKVRATDGQIFSLGLTQLTASHGHVRGETLYGVVRNVVSQAQGYTEFSDTL